MTAAEERWYWDLRRERAVREDERGPAEDLLGPYPSREAAANWRDRVERRNEAWDEDDERWHGPDDQPGGGAGTRDV
jgi:hypothetical protein